MEKDNIIDLKKVVKEAEIRAENEIDEKILSMLFDILDSEFRVFPIEHVLKNMAIVLTVLAKSYDLTPAQVMVNFAHTLEVVYDGPFEDDDEEEAED